MDNAQTHAAVEVTAADRKAAFALLVGEAIGGGDGGTYVARQPSAKDAALAFARHRLAHQSGATDVELMRAAVSDTQVREAMQEAWDDFCSDAQAHPDDIYREGRKTFFRAGRWADLTAAHLRHVMQRDAAMLAASPTPPNAPDGGGSVGAVRPGEVETRMRRPIEEQREQAIAIAQKLMVAYFGPGKSSAVPASWVVDAMIEFAALAHPVDAGTEKLAEAWGAIKREFRVQLEHGGPYPEIADMDAAVAALSQAGGIAEDGR